MQKKCLCLLTVLSLTLTSVRAEEAKVNFEAKCAGCHGKDGKGETKAGQKLGTLNFTDPKVQESKKDEAMFKAIKEGIKKGDTPLMKPYADKLTDEEIKALVKYVRNFKK